jgi:segregation and condensation protein B
MEKIKAVIEALIFASESPLAPEKIRPVLPDVEKTEIKEIIDQLMAEYNERQGGIILQEVAGGFQFRTNPEISQWVKKLKSTKPHSLSPQAMETLAIIAYKQPIVKTEIEDIRGVDVGGPLKGLLEKKLIRIVGRKDVPGKPIIYGTTRKFLEVFNLKDIMDLPNLRELRELNRQQEQVELEIEDELIKEGNPEEEKTGEEKTVEAKIREVNIEEVKIVDAEIEATNTEKVNLEEEKIEQEYAEEEKTGDVEIEAANTEKVNLEEKNPEKENSGEEEIKEEKVEKEKTEDKTDL